jgi:hypothetical protein
MYETRGGNEGIIKCYIACRQMSRCSVDEIVTQTLKHYVNYGAVIRGAREGVYHSEGLDLYYTTSKLDMTHRRWYSCIYQAVL